VGRKAEEEIVDPFTVAPFSATDIVIHVTGAALNLGGLVPAVAWLGANLPLLRDGWFWAILAVACGSYIADFVTGFLHWAFDTWFGEDWPAIRRMVLLVREHHIHPERIFRYSFWHDAGMLSWFAFLISAPVFAWVLLRGGPARPIHAAMVLGAAVASLEIVFMLEFHKFGHRLQRPLFVRALQRLHLLLSPTQHLRHHSGPHDSNYCLITGDFDRTAGRLGAWRLLERAISGLTGWAPRENDRAWFRRYGR
jgi:Lipid desaturase domain